MEGKIIEQVDEKAIEVIPTEGFKAGKATMIGGIIVGAIALTGFLVKKHKVKKAEKEESKIVEVGDTEENEEDTEEPEE